MWRFCAILFVGVLLEVQCAPAEVGKSKEKVRAYEFGYSIEENQHRHEKRDENGIVMGEFGFITADGIYHVTVYATDENGKFKILAMKNYPYRSPEKKPTAVTVPPPPKKPLVLPPLIKATPLDTPSCGGCILTKKLTDDADDVAENPEAVFRPLSRTLDDLPATRPPVFPAPRPNAIGSPAAKAASPGAPPSGKGLQSTGLGKPGLPTQSVPGNRQSKAFAPSAPRLGQTFNSPPLTTSGGRPSVSPPPPNTATVLKAKEKSFQPLSKVLPNGPGPVTQNTNTNSLRKQTVTATITPISKPNKALGTPQLTNTNAPTGVQQRNTNGAKTPTPSNLPSTKSQTPFSPSNGKSTPTSSTGGGGPLYRFKYVLDYNGHSEEGRIDGSKEGKYNTIDEDGIRRIIDYIANENGYQPHIKWERIPASEIPTGENKLKEYEFVWFN